MTACSSPIASPVEPRLGVCGPPFDPRNQSEGRQAQGEGCAHGTGGVAANAHGTARAETMR